MIRRFSLGQRALTATPTEPSTNTVTTQLTAYLNAEISAGFITSDQKTAALATYNDATITSEIPAPNMRAALASLTGTIANGAIAQFTTSANVTGKAFTVVDFSTEVSTAAEIAETTGNVTTKRIRTLFKTSFKGESFLTLAPFLAHEALHQDLVGADPTLPDAIPEEEFANSVETYVWAQELVNSPAVAAAHTELSTHLNADLLAMLNSGLALFPRVGEATAPINSGNALPKSSPTAGGTSAFLSFEDYTERTYAARNFSNATTTANPYALQVLNNITLGSATTLATFSQSAIDQMDANQQIISDKNAVALAHVLRLGITK